MATIRNLIIDKSCSWSGTYASALSILSKGNVTIENVVNHANVNGKEEAAPFIANVEPLESSFVSFVNCMNTGDIVSATGRASGLYNIGGDNVGMASVSVKNSVNKGKVSGVSARGISNFLNEANCVVSVGEVVGINVSYLTWDHSPNATISASYGVKESCETCNDSYVSIHRYGEKGTHYYMTDKAIRADEILNNEAHKEGYGLYWTRELSLTDHFLI